MKLHKRILSAAAALLVLTSAVDFTQIAQFSLVAAAADVGEIDSNEIDEIGDGSETGNGNETAESDDETGNGDDETGEAGDGSDETGEAGDGDETGESGDGEEEKPSTGGEETDPTTPGGNEGNESSDDKSDLTITYEGLKYLIPGGSSNAIVKGLAAEFTEGKLVIPSKVTNNSVTYTVTAIAADAFDGEDIDCAGITSVVIPKGVTAIGRNAFYGCENLESVELPNSLAVIDYHAFSNCPIDTIKFNGTEKQWNDLTKDSDLGIQTSYNVDYSDGTDPDEPDPSEPVNVDIQGGYYDPEEPFTQDTNIILHGDITLSGTIRVESGNVTIIGNGNTITRHADFSSTMILVDEGATLTIDNVTIDGNNARAYSAAVYNKGTLYINNSVVKNNRNTAVRTLSDDNEAVNALFVGGIANDGTLELTDSAVYGNTANGSQSNIVAECNEVNKAVTIINSGIIVGEIDGVTLKAGVNRGTVKTDVEGEFTVTNGTNSVVCTDGDALYANAALKAKVGDIEKTMDYDNLTWSFYVNEKKPADKLTWIAGSVINALEIDNDTEITLGGNVTVNDVIHIKSGDVVINGNNRTITRSNSFLHTMFLVDEGASLTINDVTFDGNKNVNAYSAIIVNDGILTANNCVFKNNNNTSVRTYSNALYVGGVANNGTLALNNCAAYGNTAGDDAQSNVKNTVDAVTVTTTVNGGLIVGDIGGRVTLNNSVKGTIRTNAKGSFTVTNGTKDVVCKNGDVLYANPTGLAARTDKERKAITFENSEWKFSVADSPETIEWKAGTVVNGLEITKNTEIKIVPGDSYPYPTSVTLNGAIDIKSGNVTILGDGFTITRGEKFTNTMVIVREGATLTVDRVVFDGNKENVQAGPFRCVFENSGTLKIDRSVIKNNSNNSKGSSGWGGFTYYPWSSGIVNVGTLELTNSTITGNYACCGSGAITNVGDANIVNCDIYDNTSEFVGGVENDGKLTISNSRIYDNKGDYGVGGITGCMDDSNEITLPYKQSETVINNCSIYGNTKLGKQSNVQVTTNNRMSINGGLIVGEIDGNGTVTLDKNMRKGTVNAIATDYFEVTNGTNTAKVKLGDTLYANPTGLRATIGNKTFDAVFDNSKWIFSDKVIITYELNGGTITGTFENPKSYQYGNKVQFPSLTRNGYTFGGWYEDSLFAFPVKDTANVTATSNRTYYAKWTQNSGTQQPGTNLPGTSNPGTSQPGTSNPGTSNPGTSQPGISDLINKGVIVGTNAPQGVIVSTLSDLVKYVLTNADIEAFQNNKKIDISLGITNINGSAPQSDRAVIEEFLRTLNGYRLGYLLDLTLYKTVGSDLYTVKETSGELTISINVPETLKASGRTFGIVRVHNGVAAFLQDIDNNADTITFKTDKFSTYAIVYKDNQSGSSDNSTNPETGNRTSPIIAIAPVASSLTLAVTAKRKKKEEE